jgi:tRNA(Ile)-lysidine synthase
MSKSEFSLIEKRVSEKIEELFSENPKFVVGVSGGADSMALLFVIRELNINALVVHINYDLRGDESDKDQELVEGIAFEWGFECCSINLDSKKALHKNFQNWAREERYKIFNDLSDEIDADGVVIAHHKDDQVETIVQKLFRGSSPESWTGMGEWDGKLFRPLLAFSKKEILQYCEDKAIPYRTDQSNLKSKYARNFLRNELSDELDSRFPGWQENILKLQDFGKLNEALLDELSSRYFDSSRFKITRLDLSNTLVIKALLKKFIEQHINSVSRGLIDEAFNLIQSQTGAILELSEMITLVRERDHLIIKQDQPLIESVTILSEDLKFGIDVNGLELKVDDKPSSELYLDMNSLEFPLFLRRWNNGDKIQPLGMKGSQKVSDHLTNKKVPTSVKENSLVLTDSDSTIYAIIYSLKESPSGTISEICKATDSTKQYLLITTKKQA